MRTLALLLPCLSILATAQELPDASARIRKEATEHSQATAILHQLTDRFGPRLTGSPNHEAAARWAADQLKAWGLKDARLEAWDFGHPGWSNARASALLLSPAQKSLAVEAVAWTPSTNGILKAELVQVIPPAGKREEVEAWMQANRAKVKGRIVLVGEVAVPDRKAKAPAKPEPGTLKPKELEALLGPWLVSSGALARVFDGAGALGRMREYHNLSFEPTKAVPGAILRNEDCGRMVRLLQDGEKVRLALDLQNRVHPAKNSFNVLAELPGTDKAEEVVMIGAHLDCWHVANGATDNAANASAMMEAVRILAQSGLKPRRTVRIGLWSGEEQGLLGSDAYVKAKLGSFEAPTPEFGKVLCYFNMDSGAGPIRSVMLFGPPTALEGLKKVVAPLDDLGVKGVRPFLSRAYGSTDSSCFSHAGISTVDLMQDESGLGSAYHSNLDTFERVRPEDLSGNATIIASLVWQLASSPDPLPRFTQTDMPKPE